MPHTQLIEYIQKSLESGATIEQVTPALVGQGWSVQDIKYAAAKASEIISQKNNIPVPPPAPPQKTVGNVNVKSLSASQVLLYLGGMIVIIAGIIYVGINWAQWGSIGRVCAILLPMLVCYVAGIYMWLSEEKKRNSLAFITVGALLFPFFLMVLINEMRIFTTLFTNEFNLTISLICFTLYLVSSFIFRHSIWSLLYHMAGLGVCYSFFRIIGVSSVFMQPTMAWIFLVLGTVYLLLGLLYDRLGQEESGRYSYSIGAALVVFSIIRLFSETLIYDKHYLLWILLILGAVYFLIGAFFERRGYKKYTQAPYFIGVGVVFFALLRLGMNGTLLNTFIGQPTVYSSDIIGWSHIIIGIAYLLIGYLLGSLKNFGLTEAQKYKEFFALIAPFWILGALFYLGLGGHKPIYETLLLLVSVGCIFSSIKNLARHYLFVGTVFLVIYIFSIGSEYFQNQVGWPLTLFVAGLISMGIGVAMERVRRKYFIKT